MARSPTPTAAPSLAGRFAAAVALAIGFYVLALVIAGALLSAAILPWALGGHGNVWVTLIGLSLGVTILVALVPRRHRFEAPGVRVTDDDEPRLVRWVEAEAAAAGERPPDEVYITLEANAGVTEVGRRRRVLLLGLPLMHLLTARGLQSVVAHEFGHYAGGDTRLGPWIARTRATIGRTIDQLSDENGSETWSQRAVRAPFIWYGNAFLRITNAISRRQEFAADGFAARRTGRDVHVAALRRIHGYGPVFDSYWADEVVPILETGRAPDVAGGFARFAENPWVGRAAQDLVDREIAESKPDPYASHPTLAERVAAAEALPAGEPDTSGPATDLIDDLPGLQDRILGQLLGPDAYAEFQPIDWADVGTAVYLERDVALAEHFADVLEGRVAADLGDAATDLGPLAAHVQRIDRDLEAANATAAAAAVLGAGLTVALAAAGWAVEAAPAEPVTCRRGDDRLAPHMIVNELREGTRPAADWRAEAERLGIADLALNARRARVDSRALR
jgi:heat shock protein HtpX